MLTNGDRDRRTRRERLILLSFAVVVTLLISLGYLVLGTVALFAAVFVALIAVDAECTRYETKAFEARRALHNAYIAKQQILDLSLDVICTLDRQGRFAEVSAACNTLWGYAPKELIGRPWTEHLSPGDRQKTLDMAFRGHATRTFDTRYVHKNGSVVDVMWSARWSPQAEMTFCVARDVTERRVGLDGAPAVAGSVGGATAGLPTVARSGSAAKAG